MKRYQYVTEYAGISGIYFRSLMRAIVSIGRLEERSLRVLDFGAGHGMLKKLFPNVEIINYDIIPELTDVSDWKSVVFDLVVVNEVLQMFKKSEIKKFLSDLYEVNTKAELIVGISRQSVLNNIGKHLLFQPDAHKGTKTLPASQIATLKSEMNVINHKSVFMLADIFLFKFKNSD